MSPAATPGYVKNMIYRSLQTLVDPEPSDKDKNQVRDFFDNQCAYCGEPLMQRGDIDHLVPAARGKGGSNSLANRVLSCKSCNSKEKRAEDWTAFLKQKCPPGTFRKRRLKIQQWIKRNGGNRLLDPQTRERVDREYDLAREAYDGAVARIKIVC